MEVWRLKKGSEKKFRSHHPWVFSSELAQSPRGVGAGALVELRDYQDRFLAIGYGHPNSQISFRTLSLQKGETISTAFLLGRLQQASHLRRLAGVHAFSHRLCFAEGDLLPGLIIDRYRLAGDSRQQTGQVYVIQNSTAGADRLLPELLQALEAFTVEEQQAPGELSWEQTSVILSNDSKSRLIETLAVEGKRVLKAAAEFTAEEARILIQPPAPSLPPSLFRVNFLAGQKTGFFLDQRFNVQLAANIVGAMMKSRRELKVLDLFCYVGQWGAQLSSLAAAAGGQAYVTLVDASSEALTRAAANVEAQGGQARLEKMDILENLARPESHIPDREYDVVICDPPAFIKKRKDLPTGTQAYQKINREALRKLKSGGLFVSCSCSGLLSEEDFRGVLARTTASSGIDLRWLLRGGHSPDHPQRAEFPQGTYLKAWLGISRS